MVINRTAGNSALGYGAAVPPEAAVLRCPSCGAHTAPGVANCAFCAARLATIACPTCLAAVFEGMPHCPHCGSGTTRNTRGESVLLCPRCKVTLLHVDVGRLSVEECPGCDGVWLDATELEGMVQSAESQSAVIAWHQNAAHPVPARRMAPVQYAPCPHCQAIMNRTNFSRISGVIIDVCHKHGTWFDRHELAAVAKFVRDGGLGKSRAAEMQRLQEERRRTKVAQMGPGLGAELGARRTQEGIDAGSILVNLIRLFS